MAKKIEDAEVKKECPSCGLGVSLDSTVCEFCGWDFEEEDEWILQIEKLERDLMLEKQRFQPGSVEEKIQSTLHAPIEERKEMERAKREETGVAPPVKVSPREPGRSREPAALEAPAKEPPPRRAEQVPVVTSPQEIRVRTIKAAVPEVVEPEEEADVRPVAQPTRVVRKASAPETAGASGAHEGKTKKVRVVRKVKQ